MRVLFSLLLLVVVSLSAVAQPNVAGMNPLDPARRAFQQGDQDRALAALNEADKGGEPRAQSLDLRGCILMEQRKFDEAVKLFDAAHAADKNTFAHIHKGDALLRQGKWSEARDTYRVAMKETTILISNERLRFGVFVTHLGEKDEGAAQGALEQIVFPTESPAYYYAQAAWSYSHGKKREGDKWLKRANEIFSPKATAWFARPLFDFGWIKTKPVLVSD